MRFVTNEGEFGILLARPAVVRPDLDPATALFRFQLLLDGKVIGDAEPCVPSTAFGHLRKPYRAEETQSARFPADPDALYAHLRADPDLRDRTTAPQAESLDGWTTHLFVARSRVVLLARKPRDGGEAAGGEILSCSVGIDEYFDVVGCAFEYWNLVRMNVPRFF